MATVAAQTSTANKIQIDDMTANDKHTGAKDIQTHVDAYLSHHYMLNLQGMPAPLETEGACPLSKRQLPELR